ncbi:MAG: hypothetical protein ACJ790_03555 [Myxococcaceae bacterium]
MAFIALAAFLALVSAGAWLFIVIHAFQRSVGTGFLVMLIPFYLLWYAFSQFEHPQKGIILAAFFGAGMLSVILYSAMGSQLVVSDAPPVELP